MLEEFIAAMRAADCAPLDEARIVATDKVTSYKIVGHKNSSGSYQLKITPDFGVGWFRDFKTGETHKWNSKIAKHYSKEERAEFKKRMDEEQSAREKERTEREVTAAAKAKKIWGQSVIIGESDYLKRKKISAAGARFYRGLIVVPIYCDGTIASLQFITPTGEKRFLSGGKMKAGYAPLANANDDKSTLVICEGWATGVSIREATQFPVIVAFTAGNLEPVARQIRKKYGDARIIIAADNDCETQPNTGIEAAKQAGVKIGAHVIWPESLDEKKIDFNDLHCWTGLDAVKDRMLAVLSANPAQQDRESVPEASPLADALPPPEYDGNQYYDQYEEIHVDAAAPVDNSAPFNILGHNEGHYYFLAKNSGQIVALSAPALGSMMNLYRLAPLEYWKEHYDTDGKTGTRKVCEFAANHLMDTCHRKGVFRAHNIRGIGVWLDAGRAVMHCGDYLNLAGEQIKPYVFKSKFVYPTREATMEVGEIPLTNKEAVVLREICGMLSWENKLSGELLAGWCVIAPICAAIPWRPHIWVTGESQSGKSTVISKIIIPVVGDIGLRCDSKTTEAGVRQMLNSDGRPVIFDEAESETVKERSIMEGIVSLARLSSSGGEIIKGSSGGEAQKYTARSAFCFSGINPAIKHRADESRISQLVLKRDKTSGADAKYISISQAIRESLTEEFSKRLLARTFRNMETVLHNINIFSDAACEVLGDRRAADQVGALLAGLYSLTSTQKITHEAAVAWIRSHDWNMHTAIGELGDPERLIMTIATRTIRFTLDNKTTEDSIGNLIKRAHYFKGDALKVLRDYGIWPKNDNVWIANSSPRLEALLRDTPWHTWKRTLCDLPGAVKNLPVLFSPGLNQRSVALPYEIFGIDTTQPPEYDAPPEEEVEPREWMD